MFFRRLLKSLANLMLRLVLLDGANQEEFCLSRGDLVNWNTIIGAIIRFLRSLISNLLCCDLWHDFLWQIGLYHLLKFQKTAHFDVALPKSYWGRIGHIFFL